MLTFIYNQLYHGGDFIFNKRLKLIRQSKGLTQQQVADLLGIQKGTYSGYETGRRQPDVSKIKELANIFNVTGDDLLGTNFSSINIYENEKNSQFKELEKKYHALDEHGKKLVELVINCEYERCYPVKIENLIARGHDSDKPIEVEIRTDIEPIPTDDEF